MNQIHLCGKLIKINLPREVYNLFQSTRNIASLRRSIGSVKGPLYIALIAGPIISILSSLRFFFKII